MALFEVPREQGKAHQEAEQVGQDDPFMLEMQRQTGQPVAGLETGEHQLVQGDRCQAAEADVQGVVVEQGDAQQGEREEDELERDAGQRRRFAGESQRRQAGKNYRAGTALQERFHLFEVPWQRVEF